MMFGDGISHVSYIFMARQYALDLRVHPYASMNEEICHLGMLIFTPFRAFNTLRPRQMDAIFQAPFPNASS